MYLSKVTANSARGRNWKWPPTPPYKTWIVKSLWHQMC